MVGGETRAMSRADNRHRRSAVSRWRSVVAAEDREFRSDLKAPRRPRAEPPPVLACAGLPPERAATPLAWGRRSPCTVSCRASVDRRGRRHGRSPSPRLRRQLHRSPPARRTQLHARTGRPCWPETPARRVRSRSVADAACRKRMPAPLAGPCRTRGSDRVRTASRDAQCVRGRRLHHLAVCASTRRAISARLCRGQQRPDQRREAIEAQNATIHATANHE